MRSSSSKSDSDSSEVTSTGLGALVVLLVPLVPASEVLLDCPPSGAILSICTRRSECSRPCLKICLFLRIFLMKRCVLST
uniref:Uncharacterized protein n=1 Tax=Lutzomyia longipalpis TaxID=7200 RepID=A0A7G3B3W7_LUTLO